MSILESTGGVKFAAFDENTAADHEIAAATANIKYRVLAYTLIGDGANDITWKSGTTAKSGPIGLTTGVLISPGFSPVGHLETDAGDALNLTLSTTNQVAGHIVYQEIRT